VRVKIPPINEAVKEIAVQALNESFSPANSRKYVDRRRKVVISIAA
jgi:hypothetical protein